jgi:hypothetical protein
MITLVCIFTPHGCALFVHSLIGRTEPGSFIRPLFGPQTAQQPQVFVAPAVADQRFTISLLRQQ